MARSSSALAVLASVVVTMALAQGAMATNHIVGGDLAWHVSRVEGDPTFYQDWADGNGPYHFRDTLEFWYTPGDTVVRVNDAGFDACDAANALGFFSEGHTIFPLEPPLVHGGRVYFISEDQISCGVGLKFFVDVVA